MENYSQQRVIRQLRGANHKRVAILGSGLAAHIAHKLIPDSVIITKKVTPLFLHNVYIHDTTETRLFLKILGLKRFQSVHVPIYYYDNERGSYENKITDQQREIIIREKMEGLLDDIQDMSISTTKSVDEKLNVIRFNEDEIINDLQSSCEIVELPFIGIKEDKNCVNIEFEGGEIIKYDYVINTIPQNVFSLMETAYTNYGTYRSIPVTFISTIKPIRCILDPDYMVYSFGDCRWKRVLTKDHQASIEINGDFDFKNEKIEDLFPYIFDYGFQIHKIPYGRIVSKTVLDTARIIHVGRFAEWQHSITTEHVINKIINLNL